MTRSDLHHFVIPGVQRCGTTLLARLLGTHPEIAMARPESPEPKFFFDPEAERLGRDVYVARHLPSDETVEIFGEKSTSYLDDLGALTRIRAVLPRVRIVVVLRDPVQRAISHYRFSRENGAESLPLREAFLREAERRDDFDHNRFSVSPHAYLQRGLYARRLAILESIFRRDRIHLVLLEELLDRPSEVLGEVFDFLGVARVEVEIPPEPVNPSAGGTELSPDLEAFLQGYYREANLELAKRWQLDLGSWHSPVRPLLPNRFPESVDDPIPLSLPPQVDRAAAHLQDILSSGRLGGLGPRTEECEDLLRSTLGCSAVLMTASCTAALEMAASLLDLGPGDEVLVPSFTFVSTASAFVQKGAVPVFVDSRPDTLNLDERLVEELLTPRTRAIVAMHYAGVSAELAPLRSLCEDRGLELIEDCAHGPFGKYHGAWTGTFGCLGALSFHQTKNFSSGQGGALLINRPDWIERAEILREKGTDRSRFLRGEVDRYTWVDLGSNAVMPELSAAVVSVQLARWEEVQAGRKKVWSRYTSELRDWAVSGGARLPMVPPGVEPAYHAFFVILPDETTRDRFLSHLRRHGIGAVSHYVPLHSSPMGRRVGRGECPVAEEMSRCLTRLPLYDGLSEEQQDRIVEVVTAFRW